MRWFPTQVLGLRFRRCGGGDELLLHVAAVPRPAGMTPEVRQQERVQSHHGDGNMANRPHRREDQVRTKTFFDFHF